MATLILDTSQKNSLIALCKEGKVIDVLLEPKQTATSSSLPLSIQTFLKKHHLSPHCLQAVALGIGPGSYTGVRVAASVAKSLSFSLSIPLIPYPSPLAFIPQDFQGPFLFLVPSKSGSPFILSGQACEGRFDHISIINSLPPHDITLITNEPVPASGEHTNHKGKQIHAESISLPRLAAHIHSCLQKREYTDAKDLADLKLLYLNTMKIIPSYIESVPVT